MTWLSRLRGDAVREGTPSLLPYDRFVDEGICLNKTGELQTLFSVRGLDQSSATEAERSGLREELSRGLGVLPPPWLGALDSLESSSGSPVLARESVLERARVHA